MVGFETTAQVIGHAIWQLARHPKIQDELRQEVSSLPGATFDELSTKMPLLDAVLKERWESASKSVF
jgi:cytochrome P450